MGHGKNDLASKSKDEAKSILGGEKFSASSHRAEDGGGGAGGGPVFSCLGDIMRLKSSTPPACESENQMRQRFSVGSNFVV